jgi:conjugative relaxase-like TrwC/TraI family protein
MQTTHKIEGSSAVRFARYLLAEASRGDYYTHDGQGGKSAPTQWHGPEELLRRFGIDPEKAVEMKHLGPLMQGFDPVTEKPIRPAGSNGTRVAGIDLSYAPPKEVSALWATTDPYRRAQIEVAHRKAVASTLKRIEREVALVRRKTNKVQSFEKAKALLATEVVHTTSRLGKDQDEHGIPDPQLHSHIVLLAAERKDGVLAAIESKQVMRAARENGAWYRSQLAANLQELGVGIERRQGNGERYFGVTGVSKDLSERWSTRTQEVHRAANLFRQRYGREPGPHELDSFSLSTRGSKTSASPEEVNAAWRALGEEHNQTAQRSEEAFHHWAHRNEPNVDLADELLANVTKESSMITKHELHAKAYELSAGVCRPAEADQLIVELERSGELLRLDDGTYTTKRLRELERATIASAQQRAGATVAPVTDRVLEEARLQKDRELKGSLSEEQREALETITGPGGVVILVGQAGTGKGVVLSAATDAWQKEGYEVIGTAVPGATAMRLQADTKSDRALTADSLIAKAERGHLKLGPNTVIVLDEAGMLDSERLPKLVKLVHEAGAKLVLAGDAAQLSSIGPGGLFKWLQGKVPTAELTEVHRAHHEWEREAWSEVREGEPGLALARYRAYDRLHVYDTRAEATQAMVDNWDQNRQGLPPDQTVMITDSSNEERDEMNALAQDRRAQAGELGSDRVALPGKPYGLAAGDEVIFTDKFRIKRLKRVENGITGTVIHANPEQNKVTILTRERPPRKVQVDTEKFSEISLAYAVHIRKGQGLTSETSGILAGGWQTDKEHMYVSLSRARERTDLYVSREDLGEQGMDTGAIERLGERMARSRAQQASITKDVAEPTVESERTAESEQTTEQPAQIEPATQVTPEPSTEQPEPERTAEPATPATPERALDHPEPERSADPSQQHEPSTQTAEQRELERSIEASQQHEPPAQEVQPTVQQSTEIATPSNTTQGTESEIDEVLKARRARQFDWQRPIDVDRSGDVNEQAREVEAIEHLAEQLRAEGASEETITKEIAKQTEGRDAGLERNTQAQREHERHIDKVLNEQRQRLLDEEQRHIDRDKAQLQEANAPETDRERQPEQTTQLEPDEPYIDRDDPQLQEPSAPQADREHDAGRDRHTDQDKEPTRDPYIEQAIQEAKERQESWERGIDPDRDNDRGFGIE